jgi:hypothetical protein
VRGQHSSVLTVADPDRSVAVLTEDLGLRRSRLRDACYRNGRPGTSSTSSRSKAASARDGTVHHIAFRVPDAARSSGAGNWQAAVSGAESSPPVLHPTTSGNQACSEVAHTPG